MLEDYQFVLEPLNIKQAKYIFIPVNDSTDVLDVTNNEKVKPIKGGSHWSLLVFDSKNDKFFHYDSMKNYNLKSAQALANKFFNFLHQTMGEKADILAVNHTPQQQNKYDCGVFILAITEFVIGHVLYGGNTELNLTNLKLPAQFTTVELVTKRSQIAYLLVNRNRASEQLVKSLLTKHIPNKVLPSTINNGEKKVNASTQVSNCQIPKNNWVLVNKGPKAPKQIQSGTIKCSNRFGAFSTQVEDKQEQQGRSAARPMTLAKKPSIPPKKKHRVLLLTDSHGHKCGQLLQDQLGSTFGVTSIIKPSAPLRDVTSDAEKLSKDFRTKDYVVVIGGTNDITVKNSQSVKLDFSFISEISKKTNILFPGILKRFDRPVLNKTIMGINESVNKNIEQLRTTNDNIIPINKFKINIKDHTRHGLHLNRSGKVKLCNAISAAILNNSNQRRRRAKLKENKQVTKVINEEENLLSDHTSDSIEGKKSTESHPTHYATQKLPTLQQVVNTLPSDSVCCDKSMVSPVSCAQKEMVALNEMFVNSSNLELSNVNSRDKSNLDSSGKLVADNTLMHDSNLVDKQTTNFNSFSLNSQTWPWLPHK